MCLSGNCKNPAYLDVPEPEVPEPEVPPPELPLPVAPVPELLDVSAPVLPDDCAPPGDWRLQPPVKTALNRTATSATLEVFDTVFIDDAPSHDIKTVALPAMKFACRRLTSCPRFLLRTN